MVWIDPKEKVVTNTLTRVIYVHQVQVGKNDVIRKVMYFERLIGKRTTI